MGPSAMQLGEGACSSRYPLGPAPLNRGDEGDKRERTSRPGGVMCPGAGWMRMWMDPGADWDPGTRRQCGRTRENTDRRTHVRARLRHSVSATWVPRSALSPLVEISQMDAAYEPPHSSPDAGKGAWGLERDRRPNLDGCARVFRDLGCVGGDVGRSKTEGGASLGDGTFSRCCVRSRIRPRSHVAATRAFSRRESLGSPGCRTICPHRPGLERDRPSSQPDGPDSPREDGRLDLQGGRRGKFRVLC